MLSVATICFTGCSNDDEPTEGSQDTLLPELTINQERMMVKIGPEYKKELEIQQGGGEYNAFSTNENIAKAEIIDGKVLIEGISMGNTYIIVCDKNGYYKKSPVSVYIADAIELEAAEVSFKSPVGRRGSGKMKITNGNGEYQVQSNNAKIAATVNAEGIVTVSGTAEDESTEITATVTVTDALNLTATFSVRLIPTNDPYTEEQMEEMMASSTVRYFFLEENPQATMGWMLNYYQTAGEENMTYRWEYYMYNFKITFDGDNSVGTKQNAVLNCYSYSQSTRKYINYTNKAITLKVIKNDGTKIWAIYTFMDNGVGKYGYFCDKIAK